MRSLMRSKIHKATVTEANKDYVGSITIDSELIEHVDLWPNERVLIASNTSGARLETYVIAGEPGSGEICMNGPCAHLIGVGEEIVIMPVDPNMPKNRNGLRGFILDHPRPAGQPVSGSFRRSSCACWKIGKKAIQDFAQFGRRNIPGCPDIKLIKREDARVRILHILARQRGHAFDRATVICAVRTPS